MPTRLVILIGIYPVSIIPHDIALAEPPPHSLKLHRNIGEHLYKFSLRTASDKAALDPSIPADEPAGDSSQE